MPINLNEILTDQPKIFLDMDGVVADFEKGVENLTGRKFNSFSDDEMWAVIKAAEKDGYRHWLELPKMKDADKLYKYVKKYPHEFLTSTGTWKEEQVQKEKVQWAKKYYMGVKINFTNSSKLKAKWAKPYHILIDDREKSIRPWVAAGGIGILHKNANDTIKQLKKMGF